MLRLLFDNECPRCSDIAMATERASDGRVEASSLRDSEVRAELDRLDPSWRFEPLAIEGHGDTARVVRGRRLVVRLTREVGLRHSLRLFRYLRRAQDAEARNPQKGMNRGAFLRSSAGATGALLVSGSATAWAADDATARTELLDEAARELTAVKRSQKAADAQRVFGAADWSRAVRRTADGSDPETILVELGDAQEALLVISDPATARETALVAQWTSTDSKAAMRWQRPDGELLADMTFERGTVTTMAPNGARFRNGRRINDDGVAIPTGPVDFASCFALCLGNSASSCVDECFSCAVFRSPIACIGCAVCAGPKAVTCARRCI